MPKNKRVQYDIPVDLPGSFALDAEGNLKLPVQPAVCADLLYEVRETRLRIQRECEKLEKAESALKNHFVEVLPVSSATGIAGHLALVKIESKPIPQVADWDAFYAYVRRKNAFELLQRRITESAIQERLDAKKPVPGITIFNVKKVSCTKL